ncbi:MAG: DsrE family protein [SAR324 cluster bacterium]|nr:DsrE family protein [SAR324 cluster bacterium]
MSRFLFIESQDPFEDQGATAYLGYALELSKQKHAVTVFFVENGANAVRKGADLPLRDALRDAGVEMKVDELALRERGIVASRVVDGVASAELDEMLDLLVDPETKAIWH